MIKIPNAIVKKAQQGDIDCINYLIDNLGPLIHFVVVKRLRNKTDAEECTQFILERVMRGLSTFDSKQYKFTTWFYKIVNNTFNNYLRDYINKNEGIELNDEEVYTYYEQDREKKFIQRKLADVEEYIGTELYEILLLKIGYELNFSQIAEELNIPYHKAKRSYYEAYAKAKEFLEKQNEK